MGKERGYGRREREVMIDVGMLWREMVAKSRWVSETGWWSFWSVRQKWLCILLDWEGSNYGKGYRVVMWRHHSIPLTIYSLLPFFNITYPHLSLPPFLFSHAAVLFPYITHPVGKKKIPSATCLAHAQSSPVNRFGSPGPCTCAVVPSRVTLCCTPAQKPERGASALSHGF